MKNRIKNAGFPLFFSIFILLVSFTGPEKIFSQNAPGISASVNKKAFSPGESGVLTISFKTGPKVKIPKDPEIVVTLTTGEIEGQGLQDYTGGDGDYISNSKVKYNFTVPGNAAGGSTITLSGNVKFGYCSTTDGVCKLANKDFSAKVKVK